MSNTLAVEPAALRPYQAHGLSQVTQHFNRGAKRVILSVATGGGKTFCAATHVEGAVAQGKRVLILAHRVELLMQFSGTLDGLGLDHGVIKAGHQRVRPELPIQVASVQTLVSRLRAGVSVPADLIVIDECHRAMAATYKEVLEQYTDAQVLGLTATPWRLDNQGLGDMFDEIVVAASTKDLVADGYLVEPTVYVPTKRLDLSRLRTVCGDYRESDLDSLLNNASVCGDIVEHWLKYARGLPTIAFGINVAHSQRIVGQFLEAGVSAEHVDGQTPADEREACFARLRTQGTQVLVNVDICTEGFDFPALGCVILARPTKSIVRFLQSVGRVMRPAPGKDKAICLDHAGSFLEHGFPSDPRYFGLASSTPKKPPALCPCPSCTALMRKGAGRCEACGWEEVPQNEDRERGLGAGANDDSDELVLLRPEERPSCPACGSYQVRIIRNARIGPFTYGIECRAPDCSQRVRWVKDLEGARQASDGVKKREWERLKQMCWTKRWALRWAIKQYQELFGTEPEWI